MLPATDPDPLHPGFFGTRALRLSKDIPNPARTFSLLYGDWGGGSCDSGVVATGAEGLVGTGVNGTLDLECDDDGVYATLFQVIVVFFGGVRLVSVVFALLYSVWFGSV